MTLPHDTHYSEYKVAASAAREELVAMSLCKDQARLSEGKKTVDKLNIYKAKPRRPVTNASLPISCRFVVGFHILTVGSHQ